MKVRKQIEVSRDTREKLMRVFGCSRMSVWRALNFEDDSAQSRRIRAAAQKNGGVVLHITPECETIHDADGYMRQWFGNGALLELDKKSGRMELFDRQGVVLRSATVATISELCAQQRYAQSLR